MGRSGNVSEWPMVDGFDVDGLAHPQSAITLKGTVDCSRPPMFTEDPPASGDPNPTDQAQVVLDPPPPWFFRMPFELLPHNGKR